MRVLMTGGGTAGHVNPAIAIANTIKEYEPDSEIAFVCSHNANDKARDLVPKQNYQKLYTVRICGMKKVYNPANIKTLYYMLTSPKEARKIIEEFKPDVIIGTGGYACYPVVAAGVKMGIPTALHESNAKAGKAIRRLCRSVDVVMTNFESTASSLKRAKRAVKVGNPVIKSAQSNKIAKDDGFDGHVLCFGGSLGAKFVNLAVADMLASLADKYPNVEFLHATGTDHYEYMKEEYASRQISDKKNAVLLDYIYDMDVRMAKADVVVARAGAMTISELALAGKAAILVPSPYVADNHQYLNAKTLEDAGACVLVQESELSTGRLEREVDRLLSNAAERESLSKNIVAFGEPDANKNIYDEIVRITRK